jgi:hypothetical protein
VSPLNVAAPVDPVVAVALLGVAPAGLTLAVMTTPASLTGLLLASCSCTTGCWANATPLCAVAEGAVVSATCVAAPAVPVAVKVTGLPASVPDVAVSVFVCAVEGSVQLPTVAIPLPFVVCVPPVTLPLPAAGANVTATSATGFPFASLTITEGAELTAVPAGADWVVGLLATIAAAAPAVPVAVNVTGLPESDPEVAVSVLLPALGLRVQLPTVATPLVLVVWLPPVIVPFPGATANVTATPPTGFPFASVTSTDGRELTAVPAVAV